MNIAEKELQISIKMGEQRFHAEFVQAMIKVKELIEDQREDD